MKKLILAFCLILLIELVFGQDIQYSQYYSAPLYLNPALTGAGDCYRVGGIGRSQWSGLSKPYTTVSFYADLNHEDLNSGFGILATQDKAGTSNFTTSDIGLSYRYIVGLNKKTFLRMGLQGMYTQKNINYSDVRFEDQYTGTVLNGAASSDPVSQYQNYSYLDVNAGMILHGSEKYWLGLAAHHINRPTDAFYLDQDRLPIKYSVHGGWNFKLRHAMENRNKMPLKLSPSFLYKHQLSFDQLDLGTYLISHSFLVGLWYRGVFVKKAFNIRNNDAVVFHIGFKHEKMSFIYSYDATVSKLALRNTKGSHELSFVYNFCLGWPRRHKVPNGSKSLPCPDFMKKEMQERPAL